jgi:hypothetical protein
MVVVAVCGGGGINVSSNEFTNISAKSLELNLVMFNVEFRFTYEN